jgi:hypothetical protein
VSFQRALPDAFYGEYGVSRFESPGIRRMPAELEWQFGVTLLPHSFDRLRVRGNLAGKVSADGGDIKLQDRPGLNNLRSFNPKDTLIEAVKGGTQRPISVLPYMQHKMKLSFSGLQCSSVTAR